MGLLIDMNGSRPGTVAGLVIGIGNTGLDGTKYYVLTLSPTPSDATVTIGGEVRGSLAVAEGESVKWAVERDGYVSQSGTWTATADETKTVTLAETTYTFTVSPTPSTATVKINGTVQKSVKAAAGTVISWEVSADGYTTKSGTYTMGSADYTLAVNLAAEQYTLTVSPTPSDATVRIDGTERKSITVDSGTVVSWEVSADGYVTKTGTWTATKSETIDVVLTASEENGEGGDDVGGGNDPDTEYCTFTLKVSPTDATVVINGETQS